MKRTYWILATALVLGLLLAGITGYVMWHVSHNRYVKAQVLAENAGNSEGAGIEKQSGDFADEVAKQSAGDLAQDKGKAGGNNGSGVEKAGGTAQAGVDGSGGAEGQAQGGSQNQGLADPAVRRGDPSGTGYFGEIDLGGNGGSETDSLVRLVFAGDVLLSDHVLKAYDGSGGIGGVVDKRFRDVIDSGDVFMANQEFPFSNRGTAAKDKQYTFRLPPEKTALLNELGLDIVTLANNHALDFGADALLDTCDALDGAGILRVGAGANLEEAKKPVILEVKGKTIGFLGASRVIPEGSWNASSSGPGMLTTYDSSLLVQEIKKAREACDYVVVYVHWGIERDEHPQDYQRGLAQEYIDAGADIVIGSHPHVLQGLEYYKGKPIVYSLGNFIFGSSIPRTALLVVEWDGEEEALRLVPGTSSAGFTRMVEDTEGMESFSEYITSISYGVVVAADGSVSAGD